jgi:hypothetical protein
MLFEILEELRRRGHRIVETRGIPRRRPRGDLAVLHVNATVISNEYVDYAKSYPFCVNLATTDISKKAISGAVLEKNEIWHGPIIVKSNLNNRGLPEMKLNRVAERKGHSLPFPDIQITDSYNFYDSMNDLPEGTFEDNNVVVERFIPEREGTHYAGRFWVFCGNSERCNRYISTSRLLKASNMTLEGPVNVPDELRALRRKLGFDYGKFDFVIHDGKAVLLDANRTPGYPRVLRDKLQGEFVKLADGFEHIIAENT